MTSPRGGKYRLSDMELDFVSLVPAGDDPSAVVVIAKAAPESQDLYVPDAVVVDGRKKRKKRRVEKVGDPTLSDNSRHTEDMNMPTINKSDLDPEVRAYVDALENEVDTLSAQVEKAEEDIEKAQGEVAERDALIAKMSPKDEETAAEINKALLSKADPALRTLIEKQQADLAQMAEVAKAEREARLEKEYLSKAEDLAMVSEDKPSLATLLRAAADKLSAEENETLEKVLKGANESLRQSGLFKEIGKSGAETTISKSVKALAADLMKADPTLTEAQAEAKVYETNPDLFEQAMNHQEG